MFRVAKVDADKQRSLVEVLGVTAFPAIFGLKNGIIVDNFVGILPQDEVRVLAILPQCYHIITVLLTSSYRSFATVLPSGLMQGSVYSVLLHRRPQERHGRRQLCRHFSAG